MRLGVPGTTEGGGGWNTPTGHTMAHTHTHTHTGKALTLHVLLRALQHARPADLAGTLLNLAGSQGAGTQGVLGLPGLQGGLGNKAGGMGVKGWVGEGWMGSGGADEGKINAPPHKRWTGAINEGIKTVIRVLTLPCRSF